MLPSTQKLILKAYYLDDDSKHLHSTYYMPGIVQSTLNAFSNLVTIITLYAVVV